MWLLKIVRKHGMNALTVASVAFAIYAFWYQEYAKRGEMTLFVNSASNAFVVQRDVPDLDISFRGSSLVASGKTLRFYSVQIHNTGQQHIPRGFFDDQTDFGIKLIGADILQINSVTYSVDALSTSKPQIENGDFIKLKPVNLDIGDWIRIEFLALADRGKDVSLQLSGRISGAQLIVKDETFIVPPGFIDIAFSGALPAQALRVFAYGLAFIALIVGLVFFVIGVSWLKQLAGRPIRARKVRRFTFAGIDLTDEQQETLKDVYIREGNEPLLQLLRHLSMKTPQQWTTIEKEMGGEREQVMIRRRRLLPAKFRDTPIGECLTVKGDRAPTPQLLEAITTATKAILAHTGAPFVEKNPEDDDGDIDWMLQHLEESEMPAKKQELPTS